MDSIAAFKSNNEHLWKEWLFPFQIICSLSRNFDSLFLARHDFRVHGGDESMAQKTCSLQEVLGQIDALGEVAADPDSEDDFDGEWCDEDGGWIYMVVM